MPVLRKANLSISYGQHHLLPHAAASWASGRRCSRPARSARDPEVPRSRGLGQFARNARANARCPTDTTRLNTFRPQKQNWILGQGAKTRAPGDAARRGAETSALAAGTSRAPGREVLLDTISRTWRTGEADPPGCYRGSARCYSGGAAGISRCDRSDLESHLDLATVR